jgi:hypothetical protein
VSRLSYPCRPVPCVPRLEQVLVRLWPVLSIPLWHARFQLLAGTMRDAGAMPIGVHCMAQAIDVRLPLGLVCVLLVFVMANFVAAAQQKAGGCVACLACARVNVCTWQAVLQHAFGDAGHPCCTVLIAGNYNNRLPSANTADVSFAVGVCVLCFVLRCVLGAGLIRVVVCQDQWDEMASFVTRPGECSNDCQNAEQPILFRHAQEVPHCPFVCSSLGRASCIMFRLSLVVQVTLAHLAVAPATAASSWEVGRAAAW